jgi:hypothetical protein
MKAVVAGALLFCGGTTAIQAAESHPELVPAPAMKGGLRHSVPTSLPRGTCTVIKTRDSDGVRSKRRVPARLITPTNL